MMAQKEKEPKQAQKVDFGFEKIDFAEKPARVRGVFTDVAGKYDLMNDVMSFGMHRLWKERMMDWLAPHAGQHLLDVAGGTGDIAFRFLRRAPLANVVIADMTPDMLAMGQARKEAARYRHALSWVAADAMALPFAPKSFDRYTISFGIRNVADCMTALHEAWRVLKTGGRIMVLEFSHVAIPGLRALYDGYSLTIIPVLGQMIANDKASYQYLVESIRRFPGQQEFCAMLARAGFKQVAFRNLSGGIVALYSGWKF